MCYNRIAFLEVNSSAQKPTWAALTEIARCFNAPVSQSHTSLASMRSRDSALRSRYSEKKKTVKAVIDTPFVKGLPTLMVVKESALDVSYRESTTRRTYEDPFTLGLQEVHAWVTEGRTPKTTPSDARHDLEVLDMLMKAGAAQQVRQ